MSFVAIRQKGAKKMNSVKKTARMAGFLYLIYILTTAFAGVVRSNLIVSGDAVTSAKNIMASEGLFRIGFVSDVVAAVLFLLTAWTLYVLLKPVNKNLALLFLLLMLGGVSVQCISLLNLIAALLFLSSSAYVQVLQADQRQTLAMFFLDLHENGFVIAQIFYATWLFPLGYLVFKSGFLPRILGILLLLDGFCVLIWFLQFFLFPGYETITHVGWAVSFIAEVSLCLWLLIMGVRDHKPALIAAS
jgi:hypothetical protein